IHCPRVRIVRDAYKEADPAHTIGLLRPRGERPSGRHNAEKSDDFAPSHCLPRGSGQGTKNLRLAHWRGQGVKSGQCPLWVKSGHLHLKTACPLCPQKRHPLRSSECPLCAKSGYGDLRTPARCAEDHDSVGSPDDRVGPKSATTLCRKDWLFRVNRALV